MAEVDGSAQKYKVGDRVAYYIDYLPPHSFTGKVVEECGWVAGEYVYKITVDGRSDVLGGFYVGEDEITRKLDVVQ